MIQRRLIPTYIFLIIVSVISVFPFYWMIMAATNNYVDISRGRLLPGTFALENFRNLIAQQPLGRAMADSFIYAIAVTVICLLICSLAGYGFEVYPPATIIELSRNRSFCIIWALISPLPAPSRKIIMNIPHATANPVSAVRILFRFAVSHISIRISFIICFRYD